jgi:hypothetical protein
VGFYQPFELSTEARAALLAEWPKKGEAHREAMLGFIADAIAQIRSLKEDGDLGRAPLARERAEQWRAVSRAAEALDVAIKGVSDEAVSDAFEHDLNLDHPGKEESELYGEVRGDLAKWRAHAFNVSMMADRWAAWSEGKPDHDDGKHRPRDAEAWAISEKAACAWIDWSGRRLSVSTWINRKGDRTYSPPMRFILAVLRVAEVGTEGSGIARAVCEQIIELLPNAKAPTRRKRTMREPTPRR